MCQRMNGNLVALVQAADLGGGHFGVADLFSVNHEEIIRAVQKPAVDIEGCLQAVTVQNFNQPPVLRDAIVVAEGNGFVFPLVHLCQRSLYNVFLLIASHGPPGNGVTAIAW